MFSVYKVYTAPAARRTMPKTHKSPAPIDAGSQVERAYVGIRSRIIDGTYRAGTPLSEPTLARLHGTSRTPIREALARLVEEGYVDRVPGRGHSVSRITVQLIRETFDIRRLLEAATAARAAELASDEERREISRLAEFRYAVGDLAGYRRAEAANTRFHQTIAAASRNRFAERLVRQCLLQMDRFISIGANVAPLPDEATRDHLAIAAAITERDPRRARRAMEAHLDRSRRVLTTALLGGDFQEIDIEQVP